MDKIVNMFIFNALIRQSDGMPQNWEVIEKNNEIDLAPIIDHGLTLEDIKYSYTPVSSLNVSFKDYNKNNYKILKEFINLSSKEYIELFLEKFNKLNSENFILIINSVEKTIGEEIPIDKKNSIINSFLNNREKIESILKEMNLIRMEGR